VLALSNRMQCGKERHEGRCLCRTQIIRISRHIAAALQCLANELVLSESCSHCVERRAALAACPCEHVAIAALFALKHERSLEFHGRPASQEFLRNRLTARLGAWNEAVHDEPPPVERQLASMATS
jgi:hypothetical protein